MGRIFNNPPQNQELLVGDIVNFTFTGAFSQLTLQPGRYRLECWGASGEDGSPTMVIPRHGGRGGYASGIFLNQRTSIIHAAVGSAGANGVGGFNGGGDTVGEPLAQPIFRSPAGGGASDIRINGVSLNNRIIVAGAGGGAGVGGGTSIQHGGHGGGLIGGPGIHSNWSPAPIGGGTQTDGGVGGTGFGSEGRGLDGSFGEGGRGGTTATQGGSGGAGWFGGGGGGSDIPWAGANGNSEGSAAGGGGSSYIDDNMLERLTIPGNESMPNPRGAGNVTGVTGNGHIRITVISLGADDGFVGVGILAIRDNDIGWVPEFELQETDRRFIRGPNNTLEVETHLFDLEFTGAPQSITFPAGIYTFELWGASGGIGHGTRHPRGLGGYSKGVVVFNQQTTLWIYVGRRGANHNESDLGETSFNGGGFFIDIHGWGASHQGGNGGGATDIRLVGGDWDDITSLRSRIMVAAGGGGAGPTCGDSAGAATPLQTPGHGGALEGQAGINNTPHGECFGARGNGGTQTAGGTGRGVSHQNIVTQDGMISGSVWARFGSFGRGANGNNCGAGAGSGYYGGGSGYGTGSGGGSNFISGHPGCNAIDSNGNHTNQPNHFSGIVFTETEMTRGVNQGDGKVRITSTRVTNVTCIIRDGNAVGWRDLSLRDPITIVNPPQNQELSTLDMMEFTVLDAERLLNLRPGRYLFECWGAQGGNNGGRGGYARGEYVTTTTQTARIRIGRRGSSGRNPIPLPGGFNGGGLVTNPHSDSNVGSGGGASDIRIGGSALSNRVIVAAGGGGRGVPAQTTQLGHGGGLEGLGGIANGITATGGTQTAGGEGDQANGSLGNGANGNIRAGAGGGFFGGGASSTSAGGGSSFLGNLENASTVAGDNRMADGLVRITLLEMY